MAKRRHRNPKKPAPSAEQLHSLHAPGERWQHGAEAVDEGMPEGPKVRRQRLRGGLERLAALGSIPDRAPYDAERFALAYEAATFGARRPGEGDRVKVDGGTRVFDGYSQRILDAMDDTREAIRAIREAAGILAVRVFVLAAVERLSVRSIAAQLRELGKPTDTLDATGVAPEAEAIQTTPKVDPEVETTQLLRDACAALADHYGEVSRQRRDAQESRAAA